MTFMKFVVLTIFPELMQAFWENGILRRAAAEGIISTNAVNIRDFAHNRHRTTDDRPYGGGCGMVMKPEPLTRAIGKAKQLAPNASIVLMAPQGKRFDQAMARSLAAAPGIIFICGRYEGIDERVTEQFVDLELSIGDVVLTGGELPAMVVMDGVTRLLPGALGNEDSADQDSFNHQRLDCGHYTRPPRFEGQMVPEVLLSGHHEQITRWRRTDALMRTLVRRPDLLRRKPLDIPEVALLEKWQREIEQLIRIQRDGGIDSPSGGG
jgi:tRNA (guanine37-N1)-methyltransferase